MTRVNIQFEMAKILQQSPRCLWIILVEFIALNPIVTKLEVMAGGNEGIGGVHEFTKARSMLIGRKQ